MSGPNGGQRKTTTKGTAMFQHEPLRCKVRRHVKTPSPNDPTFLMVLGASLLGALVFGAMGAYPLAVVCLFILTGCSAVAILDAALWPWPEDRDKPY